jgi:hypothetical protein
VIFVTFVTFVLTQSSASAFEDIFRQIPLRGVGDNSYHAFAGTELLCDLEGGKNIRS